MVEKIKFFCSHGGKILCDSNLNYIGGETRFVVIPRSITLLRFSFVQYSYTSSLLKYLLPNNF